MQPGRYNPNRIDLTIGKIDFLSDVKDELVDSITIDLPLSNLTEDMTFTLSELTSTPGKALLYFNIIDPEGKQNLKLQSRNHQISVNRQLIEFIKAQPELSYRIN